MCTKMAPEYIYHAPTHHIHSNIGVVAQHNYFTTQGYAIAAPKQYNVYGQSVMLNKQASQTATYANSLVNASANQTIRENAKTTFLGKVLHYANGEVLEEEQLRKSVQDQFNSSYKVVGKYFCIYIIGFIFFAILMGFLIYVGFHDPGKTSVTTSQTHQVKHHQNKRHWVISQNNDFGSEHTSSGQLANKQKLQFNNEQKHMQTSNHVSVRAHGVSRISETLSKQLYL